MDFSPFTKRMVILLIANLFLFYGIGEIGLVVNFRFEIFIGFLFFLSFYSKRTFLIIQIFLFFYFGMILYLASIANMTDFFDLWGMQIKKMIWSPDELRDLYEKNLNLYFSDYKEKLVEEREKIIEKTKNPEEMMEKMLEKYFEYKYPPLKKKLMGDPYLEVLVAFLNLWLEYSLFLNTHLIGLARIWLLLVPMENKYVVADYGTLIMENLILYLSFF